ncbi:hypothetical protein ABFX02_13G028000 [Erythranthe guttata]
MNNYEKPTQSYYQVPGLIPWEDDEEDDEKTSSNGGDERKAAFWDSHDKLLQEHLFRTTLFESKIRRATKDVVRKLNSDGGGVRCSCRRRMAAVGCRSCIMKEVSVQLRVSGFDCVVCHSNWKSSKKIPAGQHTYLEVTERKPGSSQKREKKVIIELNFRDEYEMARASDEYKKLVAKLPEIFVAKSERLTDLVNILCTCSKKCMKEKKMYLAPWRKHEYMQAKWQGKPLRLAASAAAPPLFVVEPPKAPPKQRANELVLDRFFCSQITAGAC